MIVAAIADVHGRTGALSQIAEGIHRADLVLLTGDLTSFGRAEQAARVVEAVREHNEQILAVTGNCDHPDAARYLAEEGISLEEHGRVVDGVAFVGLGGSLPCPANTPNEYGERELRRRLSSAVEQVRAGQSWVLVSHQPPIDTRLDLAGGTRHVGSRAVRECIQEHQPILCFMGHIHEAAGIDSIGRTRLVNPGPLHLGRYARAEVADGALLTLEVRGPGREEKGR